MSNARYSDSALGSDSPLNHAISQRDNNVQRMVRDAIAHKQTMLAYQSVMIARDPGMVGFHEGLIRVLDDTGRVIPAREFINDIERTELGREIDRLALRMGLQSLAENPGARIAINMSARSIGYRPWMQVLTNWLKRDPTLGERLILEITESSAMDQPEVTIDFMDRLSQQGICFALDDFGAGYTSLGYLKEFYFDILKIDAKFCQGVASDTDNRALIDVMITIARHFDMLVVAEGVERKEDVEVLIAMGVDCLQGFYFDAPTTRPHWSYANAHDLNLRSSVA